MHLPSFRLSSGAPAPHWWQFWVLLLLVPACFAVVAMPITVAVVAFCLTLGVPLAVWLARHVHHATEFRAQVPAAIRTATGVSVTVLGLGGLFAFSAALAWATLAVYVGTVALMASWGKNPFGARSTASATPPDQTPTAADHEAEPTGVVVTHDMARQMSDAELCQAWRRSYVSLQAARGLRVRALVVHTRQLLLDELERRDPAGLSAWLGSGARAAGGPDRFIGNTGRGDGRPQAA
jgi:hypothetical protein